MTYLKTPYNFVPLNKKVVSPAWIPFISHDIPFEDGRSGSLELTFRAQSPLFISDGIGQEEQKAYFNDKGKGEQLKPFRFCQLEGGRYFLPGSSLKGMLRSVLEVMSFGRLEERVDDDRYALRDLGGKMKDEYLAHFKPDNIYCGWLRKDLQSNHYYLEDCGIPGRISHRELDDKLDTDFSSYFSPGGGFMPQKDTHKAARHKYDRFGSRAQAHHFAFVKRDNGGRKHFCIEPESDQTKSGTLVFTGQASPRKPGKDGKWSGKHLEFIFFESELREKEVAEEVIQNFEFAYFEQDRNRWSVDWKHWRKQLQEGEKIPVFFHKNEKDELLHLGLSYLYKLPYKQSVGDSVRHHQGGMQHDLADAIFGYTQADTNPLKGRVQIGHAFADPGTAREGEEVKEVLSSPKASYYPTYIRQQVKDNGTVNEYKTFMDEDAEIAGWKRYPVHRQGVKHNPPPNNNEKITTRFRPLQAGAVFRTRLHYHNLRPVELGALLSALSFHQSPDTFHSLGMGKPLGYGKLKLEIGGMEPEQQATYMAEFEAYMTLKLDEAWFRTRQVKELVNMAREQGEVPLEYMDLEAHRKAKNAGEALPLHTGQLPEPSEAYAVQGLADGDTLSRMKEQIAAEEAKFVAMPSRVDQAEQARQAARQALQEALDRRKAEFMAQLDRLQKERRKEERITKKEEQAAQALEGGPEWEGLSLKGNKGFEELKKTIEAYGETAYASNDIKKVVQAHPGGYLPEEHHPALWEKLDLLFANFSKRDIKQWDKPFAKNAKLKKVAEWVGEEKARAWGAEKGLG
jgi:CRISPR-associated protein (TIGR03986 family)